jgi:hypothetical protein
MAKKRRVVEKKAHRRPSDYACKDATRDLVLTIKERDISGAKKKDNNACAAANALCRQEHFKEARVYKGVTYVKKGDGSWLRYITPKDLYMEIMIFDRGGQMEIGDFKLLAPTGIKKLGAHHKPKGKGGNRTGRLPHTPHILGNVRDHAPKGRNHLAALFE